MRVALAFLPGAVGLGARAVMRALLIGVLVAAAFVAGNRIGYRLG